MILEISRFLGAAVARGGAAVACTGAPGVGAGDEGVIMRAV